MILKKLLIPSLLAAAALVGVMLSKNETPAAKPGTSSTPPAKAPEPVQLTVGHGSLEQRHAAAHRIVTVSANLADEAKRAGFPDAQPVWFATMGNAFVGEPGTNAAGDQTFRVVETFPINEAHPPAGGRPVIVVPVLPEDSNLLWVRTWLSSKDGPAARYLPELHTIIVKLGDPISDRLLGLYVLHEAWHAKEWVTRQYDWQEPRTFADEERKTYEFQGALASAVFGEEYRNLVSREARALRDHGTRAVFLTPRNAWNVRTASRSSDYRETLDGIFGPAKSEFESALMATSVWIEATFEALGPDPDPRTVFLQSWYQKNGFVKNDGSITTRKIK